MENAQEQNIKVYRRYYSIFARDYEERTREAARNIAQTMINWIDLTNLRVLDFGVGTGAVWEELCSKGISNLHVIGLDIAPGALKIAKDKSIPWLEVIEKKAEDSNYVDCFDLVCAHGLLKHCANPRTIIGRTHTALRKGGLFFYEDPAFEDQALRIMREFVVEAEEYLEPERKKLRRKTSFNMPDAEMLQLVEKVGFLMLKHESFTYITRYDSMEQIKDFFTERTIFGTETYRTIPAKYKKKCQEIFLRIIEKELKEPLLHHTRILCLFKKL